MREAEAIIRIEMNYWETILHAILRVCRTEQSMRPRPYFQRSRPAWSSNSEAAHSPPENIQRARPHSCKQSGPAQAAQPSDACSNSILAPPQHAGSANCCLLPQGAATNAANWWTDRQQTPASTATAVRTSGARQSSETRQLCLKRHSRLLHHPTSPGHKLPRSVRGSWPQRPLALWHSASSFASFASACRIVANSTFRVLVS